MKESTVTVFGGTGFLGRRVVLRLRAHGFFVRIASRHPDRRRVPGIDGPNLNPSKPTFTTSGQSLRRLLALTV
jgi:nucleoside-diphosphate-sugar epimerase